MTATRLAAEQAELVAGHLGEDFLAQVFRRTHHIVRGAVPDPEMLCSWPTLNTILATHRLEPPRLRLAAGGETVPQHRYARPQVNRRHTVWHQLQPVDLHSRLADGATLVLDAIDELHPPVAALATALERRLRTGVQTNLYASWTGQEGFGLHWDDHDTVIVQVSGAKRWQIYGATRRWPAYRDVAPPEPPAGDPVDEFVLAPGDLLYVPRGHWHNVTASEGVHSLHLTNGLQTTTGADLISWVADQLRELDVVRADLPQFDPGDVQADVQALLAKEVGALLEQPGLIATFFAHRDAVDPGRMLAPSLPHLDAVPPDPALTVRLLTPRARLEDAGSGEVRLRAAGNDWRFAGAARPLLEALLPCAPVTLGELAARSGLPVGDVAAVVAELAAQQAAAVNQPGAV